MNDDRVDRGADQPELTDELRSFAVELSRLRPRDDRIDRERLAFLAGRAVGVNETNRTAKLCGLPLESRAWPAAFVAMTSVAAGLVVALCLRSADSRRGSLLASEPIKRAVASVAVEARKDSDVLSTRDAYLPDLESRLFRREKSQRETGAAAPTTSDERRPVLTPTAWDQAINGSQPSRPSPDDDSDLSRNQGANS